MKLVLLPGLDGTGELFAPFIREISAATQIVRYPHDAHAEYSELEAVVRAALPTQEEFALLGESFSGPVAISIASDPPPNLKSLVLCCTFASTPQPLLASLRHLLPILPAPPLWMLEALLCGRFLNPEVRGLLAQALQQVPLRVLKARARAAATIDVSSKLRAIRLPILYLRASEDRVVPASAMRRVVKNSQDIRCVELVAPHFLLQTVPEAAAKAIAAFMVEGSHVT